MDDLFFKNASMQTLPITFTRYLKLSRDIERISITRALQYEIIRSHPFNGLLLDVGGGRNADYLSMINCEVYEAINIDAAMEPTWKVGVGERFPCSSEQYDTVISFNTLEHVFDPRFIINEMTRVIKKGGKLAITTPFLFPIHGHPDDYFRPTPSWYNQTLKELGYKDVIITPLYWGPFTTGQTCSGIPGPAKAIRKQLALALDFVYAKLTRRINALEDSDLSLRQRLATGFFIFARK